MSRFAMQVTMLIAWCLSTLAVFTGFAMVLP